MSVLGLGLWPDACAWGWARLACDEIYRQLQLALKFLECQS